MEKEKITQCLSSLKRLQVNPGVTRNKDQKSLKSVKKGMELKNSFRLGLQRIRGRRDGAGVGLRALRILSPSFSSPPTYLTVTPLILTRFKHLPLCMRQSLQIVIPRRTRFYSQTVVFPIFLLQKKLTHTNFRRSEAFALFLLVYRSQRIFQIYIESFYTYSHKALRRPFFSITFIQGRILNYNKFSEIFTCISEYILKSNDQ